MKLHHRYVCIGKQVIYIGVGTILGFRHPLGWWEVFPEDKGGTTIYICGEAQIASLAPGYSATHSHTLKSSSHSSITSNVHSPHTPDFFVMSLGFLRKPFYLSHSSGTHSSLVTCPGNPFWTPSKCLAFRLHSQYHSVDPLSGYVRPDIITCLLICLSCWAVNHWEAISFFQYTLHLNTKMLVYFYV